MSVQQAWRQTSIANKVIAACSLTGFLIAVGSAWFSHQAVTTAQGQYALAAKVAHEQRLLEWARLVFDDQLMMPNVTPTVFPATDPTNPGGIVITLVNQGTGETEEVLLDDTATGADLLHQPIKIQPGASYDVTVQGSSLDQTHLMRLVTKSPHGSVRVKTFYLLGGHVYREVSDTVDHTFDFLIADEPGRKDHKPSVAFGFGPPEALK